MTAERPPRALVACIGSSLVSDDRVGEAVYRRLTASARLPATTRVVQLGVGGTDLVEELRAEELLVVVDALRVGAPPGSVHVIDWSQVEEAPTARPLAHDVGLPQALELTRALYPERAPRRSLLVGVQGRCFDRIGEMSSEVAAAVDEAVETVIGLVEGGVWPYSAK